MFADVILPLALPKRSYTYSVPDSLVAGLRPGLRVEVPFGKQKRYSGLVEKVHDNRPDYAVRPIISVLDSETLVSPEQLRLWEWLASYYCCTLGEVMNAALPGNLRLGSETSLVFNREFGEDFSSLSDEEYLLAEALALQDEISIEDARQILNKQTVLPVIQSLLSLGVLTLKEELQEKYRPKQIPYVMLAEPFRSEPDLLAEVYDLVEKYEKQTALLLAHNVLSRDGHAVKKSDLLKKADALASSLNSLVNKGVFVIEDRESSRIEDSNATTNDPGPLTALQKKALGEVEKEFEDKNTVLLHGVTGSGKTRIYIELIKKVMEQGGQVLYLLPEIALTTHLVGRLQSVFGNDIAVYHSRVNYNQRVEVWKSAQSGKPLILGARSGLFLPFSNLQLIIVDEEHDGSFKQFSPSPRYHARDSAIYLASLSNAKVLLGTATPSLESFHNASTGKYGMVRLPERYGGLQLPSIDTLDLKREHKTGNMRGMFSKELLNALEAAVSRGEQAILFQNRRGYSPITECQTCGWSAQCKNCDISLTYHKYSNGLRCHYCGYRAETPSSCPACGSGKINLLGFGTEKIEEELSIHLPKVRIGRMDYDTASSKSGLAAILHAFEEREIDILVGTQMVTKGLDFDNVALVGVMRADQLLKFPDFRSHERGFQLLTQVAGRAGRKKKQGQVLIQAFDPQHPIIQEVLTGDFEAFAKRELLEREEFLYPPFYRLIHVTLEHKEPSLLRDAAREFTERLREQYGRRILGPAAPGIPRLRGYYGQVVMIKSEKSPQMLNRIKLDLMDLKERLTSRKGWRQLRVTINVDPV